MPKSLTAIPASMVITWQSYANIVPSGTGRKSSKGSREVAGDVVFLDRVVYDDNPTTQ
jgi:hypothetical protein